MTSAPLSNDSSDRISRTVAHYWRARASQRQRQEQTGRVDQGARSAVTGGTQMDGLIELFRDLIGDAGIGEQHIFRKTALELPGYFRPTKEWDLLVVKEGLLIVALEAKSQVGPSLGNNFNNRTEKAMGNALDLWTAFGQGAFNASSPPFLGYFFMLEDCAASQRPVRVKEPHFEVFGEFVGASYAKRYELFYRKLVLERHYTASALITSRRDSGLQGVYHEPAPDLAAASFLRKLVAQAIAYVD